jgi:menaquinone-specific isochorismate synthase
LKFFWADRQGNPAPDHATLHVRPFLKGPILSCTNQLKTLPAPRSVKAIKRSFSPSKEEWIHNVNQALEQIKRKEIEKVVLARTYTLELEEEPDPFALTAALQKKAQGAFLFCIQSDWGSFLGATPELLFARRDRQIISEALAGTRARGQNPIEDQKLEKELLLSAKDLREFSLIPLYLQNTLSPLCNLPLSFSPISIHKTQNVQHLYSRCSGILKDHISDEEILSQLHPTPALCGTPKEKACALIQQLEPFERKFYGGLIGWTTLEKSEWAVGIRCCFIQGKKATLYSGTGIVEGSDPEKEWEELDQKIKLYSELF